MASYQIQRWDQVPTANPDTHIPPKVEKIAKEVMAQYKMQVQSKTLITTKPDKGGAIWKLATDKGPRSLKLLHRLPSRSHFSIGAQDYLVKKGARVPALVRTKDNKLYVEAGGKAWIVTEWIEQLQPPSKIDLKGAEQLCYGLGEFHRKSKGYVPPAAAAKSSRLRRWPDYYEKLLTKIGWFQDVAKVYKNYAASNKLLSVTDTFANQARNSLERLRKSSYAKMVAKGEAHWGLVHQDYGWSNGQLGPGGLWVIDLDGVAYDLPIRDLRKLITSTMEDLGKWDLKWARGMINAYHKANPIDAETYEILMIDLSLPNEFYKHTKEIFHEPEVFLKTEAANMLTHVLECEKTKWSALKELQKDSKNFKSGKYGK
ncbi:CotS family spore coat protein [Paenibacillus sedimenti]|uniref:CotS family spore coat protein n=1 Tax=Paenibacillus sedimenti TaxID=2770274 RepID=A0A926KR18_9BACL|nr:CotS family spore coat protein [Paenibacillus sedimenti]MBD0381556.1 CotS family spore coat protein [Paenibacillus sedimenti]